MKYEVNLGSLEKRGKSWRVSLSLGFDKEQGDYVYLRRTCKGNKRDAEIYRSKLRELASYAIPSKPEGVELLEWVSHLEKLAVNKPEGVSWASWVQQVEEMERKKASAKTLEEYATAWHKYRAENADITKATITAERTVVNRICKYLGSYELEQLTPDIIKGAYSQIKDDGLTDDCVLRFHKKLKQILETAYEDDLIPKNPITKNRVPTPKTKKVAERVSLSLPKAVELQGVLDEAGDYQSEYLAVRIGLNTGLRIGEVAGLTWENFDIIGGGVLKVRKQVTKFREVTNLKTQASARNISLDDETIKHLLAWKEHQREYLATLRILQSDATPIITNQVGGFYDTHGLRRWFRKFCARNGFGAFYFEDTKEVAEPTEYEVDNRGRAGSRRKDGNGRDANGKPYSRNNKKPKRKVHYEGLKFHELRHTQATLLLAHGEDIKTVQARLGHSKASTTLDMYAHAIPEKDKEAAKLIGDLLNGKQAQLTAK